MWGSGVVLKRVIRVSQDKITLRVNFPRGWLQPFPFGPLRPVQNLFKNIKMHVPVPAGAFVRAVTLGQVANAIENAKLDVKGWRVIRK